MRSRGSLDHARKVARQFAGATLFEFTQAFGGRAGVGRKGVSAPGHFLYGEQGRVGAEEELVEGYQATATRCRAGDCRVGRPRDARRGAALLRRLIPFPGARRAVALSLAADGRCRAAPAVECPVNAVADMVGEQAASIVVAGGVDPRLKRWRGACSPRAAPGRDAPLRRLGRGNPCAAPDARSGRQLRGGVAEPAELPSAPARPPRLSRQRPTPDALAEVQATSDGEARPARHDLDDAVQQRESAGAPRSRGRPILLGSRGGRIARRFSSSRRRSQSGTAGAKRPHDVDDRSR